MFFIIPEYSRVGFYELVLLFRPYLTAWFWQFWSHRFRCPVTVIFTLETLPPVDKPLKWLEAYDIPTRLMSKVSRLSCVRTSKRCKRSCGSRMARDRAFSHLKLLIVYERTTLRRGKSLTREPASEQTYRNSRENIHIGLKVSFTIQRQLLINGRFEIESSSHWILLKRNYLRISGLMAKTVLNAVALSNEKIDFLALFRYFGYLATSKSSSLLEISENWFVQFINTIFSQSKRSKKCFDKIPDFRMNSNKNNELSFDKTWKPANLKLRASREFYFEPLAHCWEFKVKVRFWSQTLI